MSDLIRTAAAAILNATQKRSDNIAASLKREIWEVGAAFLEAINSNEEIKAIKRGDIAKEYIIQREAAGLQPMAYQYWLKALQLVEAMPSKALYMNTAQTLSVSCLQELAPLAKPKNFNVKIGDIVAHVIEQGLSTTTEIRSYVQTCRKVQPKKSDKKSVKKAVTNSKKVAMSRQIAKELLKAIQPADSETKTISLKDACEAKGTKKQLAEKLTEINTILVAIAAAK